MLQEIFCQKNCLLFFAPAQCGLTISKMLRLEMRCHQPGISNRILSVLLHHETFRPLAAWIQSCKLPQPFTRLSIYVKLPKLSQQTFGREEIVLIKVDAFWQKTNSPKLNQSSDDFESCLVLRDTKVAKRLSRNLSAFAITTTQWTPLLFCVGAIRKKNDIHTCVLLTPCLLADDMLTFLCFFSQWIKFPLRFRHTFSLLRRNACIVILHQQWLEWRTTLWGFNASELFFCSSFHHFYVTFYKKNDCFKQKPIFRSKDYHKEWKSIKVWKRWSDSQQRRVNGLTAIDSPFRFSKKLSSGGTLSARESRRMQNWLKMSKKYSASKQVKIANYISVNNQLSIVPPI